MTLIYKITETTNSQTPIKSFSLKANENVQKLIEEFLIKNGIYYERRINFYRNKGLRNAVSIQKLFQVYVSQILYKPSQVKTTPKTMFKDIYDDVFPSPNVKIQDFLLYLVPIKIDIAISKKIRAIKKDKSVNDPYTNMLYSYAKLHLGPFVLHSILGKGYDQKEIVSKSKVILKLIDNEKKFEPYFNTAVENLKKTIQNFAGSKKEAIPSAVKKSELDEKIVRFIKKSN